MEESTEDVPGNEQLTKPKHVLPRDARGTFAVNGFGNNQLSGVAGWSDDSDVSQAASTALQVSSGFDVPPASFVAKMLGLYLLILVPLNWLLFRLMGRVEWAWAVIPILSIGGAIAVTRATQLDVGFVRSRTELGVIEMQPGYDRAHLTRYIGFFTSLAAPYQLTGEDASTLILPIANINEQRTSKLVDLHVGNEVKMDGFAVKSSSTGFVHAEQMLNVGGAIELTKEGLANNSNLDVKGAVVVRRVDEESVAIAKIGELAAGVSVSNLEFEPCKRTRLEYEKWEQNPATSSRKAGLNIRPILDIAAAPDRLGIGECVLVGWTDELIAGIKVKPAASQVVARSVVVAQLKHAVRPIPKLDNTSFVVADHRHKVRRANFFFGLKSTDMQKRSSIQRAKSLMTGLNTAHPLFT